MTANATIDLISAMAPNATQAPAKQNTGEGFGEVFENVNKEYSAANSTDSVKSESRDKEVVEKTSQDKTENKAENVAKAEENSANDAAVKSDSTEEQIKDILKKIAEQLQNSDSNLNLNSPETVSALSQDISTLDALIQKFTKELKEGKSQNPEANANLLNDVQNLMADLSQAGIGLDAQISQRMTSLNENLVQANLQNGVLKSELAIASADLKIQTQGQISDINTAQAQEVSQDILPEVSVVDSPVIEVAAELADVQVNETEVEKQNVKEALGKASISQEIIDETDAKVVKVEKASNSSQNQGNSNFLNGQNAQEEAVKLSLQDSDAAAMSAENLGQTTFAKVSDTVQVQPQQHVSKEISQTEILSQVHSKLNLPEEGASKVTIILRPENLGRINLELLSNKEGLTAQLTAENQQVKDALEKDINALKETLNNQGVNVNNVTVKVVQTQKQDNMFNFDSQGNQNNQQSPNERQAQRGEFSSVATQEENVVEELEESIVTQEQSIKVSSHLGQVDYKI